MKNLILKLKFLLSTKQRYYVCLVFLCAFLVSAIETIGLGSIAGFVMVLTDPFVVIDKIPEGNIKTYLANKEFSFLAILSTIIITAIFLIKNLFIILFHLFESQIKRNIMNSNSIKIYSYYLNSPYSFHLKNNPSKLINNIINEVTRSTNYIFNFLLCFREILLVISLLFTLIFVDWKISFVIFAMMSFVSGIFYFSVQKKIKEIGNRVRKYSEKMLQNLNQGFGAVKITKILGRQQFIIEQYYKEQDAKLKNQVYHTFFEKLPRLFLEVLAILTVSLTTLFFILEDRSIQTVLPTLTLLALIIMRMVPAFVNINVGFANLQYNSSAFQKLFSELEKYHFKENSTKVIENSNSNLWKNIDTISLLSISYNYPGTSKKILNDISLKINQGEMVGIIGRTGAGKSTLIDLILGLLTPSKGKIQINSIDINQNLRHWQRQLGYVPQDIYLIDDSIKRNIAFGMKDENIEERKVKECLKSAQLIDFVNTLTDGVETYIGDRGIRLSGGQKQRIGIARALYNNPKILIMDEATSALDNETEENLIRDIVKLRKEKTLIIIAHRLTTLKNCDKLFLLDSGKLIDEGTSQEMAMRHKKLEIYLKLNN